VLGHLVGQRAARQLVQEAVEVLRALAADEAAVHLDARREVAVGEALGLFEGEQPVGGRAAGPHAEALLGVLKELVRAAEQAGDIGAHRDHVLATGSVWSMS